MNMRFRDIYWQIGVVIQEFKDLEVRKDIYLLLLEEKLSPGANWTPLQEGKLLGSPGPAHPSLLLLLKS